MEAFRLVRCEKEHWKNQSSVISMIYFKMMHQRDFFCHNLSSQNTYWIACFIFLKLVSSLYLSNSVTFDAWKDINHKMIQYFEVRVGDGTVPIIHWNPNIYEVYLLLISWTHLMITSCMFIFCILRKLWFQPKNLLFS